MSVALRLLVGAALAGVFFAPSVRADVNGIPTPPTVRSSAGGSGAVGTGGSAAVGSGGAASVAATAPQIGDACKESVPDGKQPPKLVQSFPSKGKAGFALELRIEIEHGKGETVLPGGFEIVPETDGAKVLARAGFEVPDVAGPSGPRVSPLEGGKSGSQVTISFLTLPSEPGSKSLILPRLPIAISRASGEISTVCTEPHPVVIEEPTASEPHAAPKPNPAPHRQLEVWETLRTALIGGLAALVFGALVFWLVRKWMRREKKLPPPPPPRPPWEVAMEELHAVRFAGLIDEKRFAEHFDRVSHIVRDYLGKRYGFDGLESTTRETLRLLGEVRPEPGPIATIRQFLRQADLVKFAQLTPTEDECRDALSRGDAVVRETIPGSVAPPRTNVGSTPAPDELARDHEEGRG